MDNNTSFGGPTDGATAPSKGPTIGAIIVVIVLIAGAAYFLWQKGQNWAEAPTGGDGATTTPITLTTPDSTSITPDPVTNQIENQNSSDDLQAIENDLQATNFDQLDAGLQQLELELGQQ